MIYRKTHIWHQHPILLLTVFVLFSMLLTTLAQADEDYAGRLFMNESAPVHSGIDLNVDWGEDNDRDQAGFNWLTPSNLHGQVQQGVYMLQISNTPSSSSSLLDRENSSAMKMTLGVGYRDPAVNQALDSGMGEDDLLLGTRQDQYRITGPMMFMSIGKRW